MLTYLWALRKKLSIIFCLYCLAIGHSKAETNLIIRVKLSKSKTVAAISSSRSVEQDQGYSIKKFSTLRKMQSAGSFYRGLASPCDLEALLAVTEFCS